MTLSISSDVLPVAAGSYPAAEDTLNNLYLILLVDIMTPAGRPVNHWRISDTLSDEFDRRFVFSATHALIIRHEMPTLQRVRWRSVPTTWQGNYGVLVSRS